MTSFVTIEKGLGPDGRIAVVRFDRGDGLNALSPEAMRQLTQAARSFEDDGDTSVVVLTGGSKAFSAGFDLKDPEGRSRKSMDIGSLRRHLKLGARLPGAWQDLEQITIAAIEGFCIGGGIALAVALDFRVMSRTAHIRIPEIGLGMNMSWQSIPRLLHLMGPARTKQAVIFWPTSASQPKKPMRGGWSRRLPIPARRSRRPWIWRRSLRASRRSRQP